MSNHAPDKEEHPSLEEAVKSDENCSTQNQFSRLLGKLGGPEARLVSIKEGNNVSMSVLKELGVWKKQLVDYKVIFWITCGDALQETLKLVDHEKNWTIGELFCHFLRDQNASLSEAIIEAQDSNDLQAQPAKLAIHLVKEYGEEVMKVAVEHFFKIPAKEVCEKAKLLDARMKPLRISAPFSNGRRWPLRLNITWSVYLARCVTCFSQLEGGYLDESFLQHLHKICEGIKAEELKMKKINKRDLIDVAVLLPSPVKLWERVNEARPEESRKDTLTHAQSLGRHHLNRRQRAIYGFRD